jgi:hypothetical protein
VSEKVKGELQGYDGGLKQKEPVNFPLTGYGTEKM